VISAGNNVKLGRDARVEQSAVKALMPVIEKQLAPFNPRPHWAKLFTVPAEDLKAKYSRMTEFAELAQKFDPRGKFRNEFLNEYIFNG
jgi:alditol oxidase